MSIESTNLTPAGNVILTGITSVAVNGIAHPLCTIKNCLMAGVPIPAINRIYNGFLAAVAMDGFVFASSKIANDQSRRNRRSEWITVLAATVWSLPFAAICEGFMANRQVHNLPYRQCVGRSIRPAGLALTLFRELPYNGVVFVSPERSGLFGELFSGIVGGALAGGITTPLDRLKTIVQTSAQRISIPQACRSIVATNGWRGLFIGGASRSFYISTCVGIQKVFYYCFPHLLPNAFKE